MRNNNRSIVRKMARSSLAANRGRNIFLVIAITLTTFMLGTVFSIGMSLIESQKEQQVRVMGTTTHIDITGISNEHIAKLKSSEPDYIAAYGTGYTAANVQMGDMGLVLYWFDSSYWNLRTPTFTDIVGHYPQTEDEIMMPTWVLNNMGITEPKIGMSIPLTYQVDKDSSPVEKTFTLSGYYTSYVHIRSGNVDALPISKAFAEKTGHSIKDNGTVAIKYINGNIIDYNKKLMEYFGIFNSDIHVIPTYTTSNEGNTSTITALLMLVLFLMFTGYLLIYNVLSMSVSKDIRFYGLCKTIGMTPRQLQGTVFGQIVRICLIGIPIGLASTAIISFVMIPMIVTSMNAGNIQTGVVISFSPVIYIGAAVFAIITAFIGAFRPAIKAARISPIEAVRFTGMSGSNRKTQRSFYGKPFRMAWRNVFRVRRQAFLVILSLFLGLTTFLSVTTVVSSMSIDNYIASYIDSDISLTNGAFLSGKQKFTPEFIKELQSIPGITEMRTLSAEKMLMNYDPVSFKQYIDDLDARINLKQSFGGTVTDEQIKEQFSGYIIGIDSALIQKLNETLEKPIDIEAFERGEFALTDTDNPSLFSSIKTLNLTVDSSQKTLSIPLGGYLPSHYKFSLGIVAPNVYVSETLMESLVNAPIIYNIELDVEETKQSQALEIIKTMIKGDYEIGHTSKLELRESFKNTKIMTLVLGNGIACILALIGILNFVNITSSGVLARRKELVMLESIGQSKKQINQMLTLEGVIYAVITILLVTGLGSTVAYGLYKLFSMHAGYAIFSFPIIPLAIIAFIVILVCVSTPQLVYRTVNKMTIVERLREVE